MFRVDRSLCARVLHRRSRKFGWADRCGTDRQLGLHFVRRFFNPIFAVPNNRYCRRPKMWRPSCFLGYRMSRPRNIEPLNLSTLFTIFVTAWTAFSNPVLLAFYYTRGKRSEKRERFGTDTFHQTRHASTRLAVFTTCLNVRVVCNPRKLKL